jgi:hypothetical protein
MTTSKRIAGLIGPVLIAITVSDSINLHLMLGTPVDYAFPLRGFTTNFTTTGGVLRPGVLSSIARIQSRFFHGVIPHSNILFAIGAAAKGGPIAPGGARHHARTSVCELPGQLGDRQARAGRGLEQRGRRLARGVEIPRLQVAQLARTVFDE